MKIQHSLEVSGTELVSFYIIPEAVKEKLEIKPEEVKVLVFSEKQNKYVEFAPDKVKFCWNN